MSPCIAVLRGQFAAAVLAATLLGCGIKTTGKSTASFPDDITVTVMHPDGMNSSTSKTDSRSDGFGLSQQRHIITWNGANASKDEVEIDTLWLRNVNGLDYGPVSPKDSIVVDPNQGGRVTVNGQERKPRQVVIKSSTFKWTDNPKLTLQFECNHPADQVPEVTLEKRPDDRHYVYHVKFIELCGSERAVDVIVDGLHLTVNDHLRSRAFKIDGINDLTEGDAIVIDVSTAYDRITEMAKIVVNGQPLHCNRSKLGEGK